MYISPEDKEKFLSYLTDLITKHEGIAKECDEIGHGMIADILRAEARAAQMLLQRLRREDIPDEQS